MKLELKHLAPYLPYNLKIKWVDKYDIWNIGFNSDVDFNFMRYPLSTLIYTIDMGNELSWKPILRPLSDLTKEIEVDGEKFVPLYKIIRKDKSFTIDFIDVFGYENLNVSTYELLVQWHFDVFGLIDAGFAVDVNSLEDK